MVLENQSQSPRRSVELALLRPAIGDDVSFGRSFGRFVIFRTDSVSFPGMKRSGTFGGMGSLENWVGERENWVRAGGP